MNRKLTGWQIMYRHPEEEEDRVRTNSLIEPLITREAQSQIGEIVEHGVLSTPLPYQEALEMTERSLYEAFVRDCAGIRIFRRLTRQSPISPLEKIRLLEDRLRFIRIYFEQERHGLFEDRRMQQAYQCAVECIFGNGYALPSLQE